MPWSISVWRSMPSFFPNTTNAPSVGSPRTSNWPSVSFKEADVHSAPFSIIAWSAGSSLTEISCPSLWKLPVGSYPLPVTVYCSPLLKMISAIVIWFSVNVPVLSLAMILVAPKVSTAERVLTNALCSAMIRMPRERVMVETAGIASGMAATARMIEICSISTKGWSVRRPAIRTVTAAKSAAIMIAFPNLSSSISKGVFALLFPVSISLIFPTSVFIPVAVTTA